MVLLNNANSSSNSNLITVTVLIFAHLNNLTVRIKTEKFALKINI